MTLLPTSPHLEALTLSLSLISLRFWPLSTLSLPSRDESLENPKNLSKTKHMRG